MRAPALALVLVFATAAYAQPPAGLPPAMPRPHPACTTVSAPSVLDDLKVKSEAADIAMLEGSAGRVGQLHYDGGVKLTSDDPRFAGLVGLQFDDTYGLVGVSKAGDWIVLDGGGPALIEIKSVKAAHIQGAAGPPAALGRLNGGYLAAFDDGRVISRYDIAACGFGAQPVPFGGIRPPDHLLGMAPVAITNLLLAGVDSTGTRKELVTRTPGPDMALGVPEIPAVPGYQLTDVAGPLSILPSGMVALWQPFGGGTRTRIQIFDLPRWSNVNSAGRAVSQGQVVASVPVALRAAAVFLDAQGGLLHIWAVTSAEPKTPTYLFAFSLRVS